MFSLSRWKGRVKETLKSTKQRKESNSTINNNNNNSNIFGRTKGRDQQPMTAAMHNACDGDDGAGISSADKTETRRSDNNNKNNIFKSLRFLPFLSKQKEKEREERIDAKEEDAMQEGGGRRKQSKKHDSRDENDGSKWRGRGLKWRKKKKGSAAHNSNDTASTANNGVVDAYAYVDRSKNENESNVTLTVMKSITAEGEEAEAAGTRAAEEKSEPRGFTPVYRFRTLDVFPRSLRHTLNDPETPTLSKTAAVASSSSSVSSFATYNAKADNKNNNTNKNALDATTTTTTRTGANYHYRHRLRRVLSVEFIHDIEADTIDVPWSSSSPPSPLLTQSPLSQQQDVENKRQHEIEHELELEHGPQQQEQEHQADYITAAPAAAHASPIPLRPALTHRPPFEPNPIQIHDFQSLSVLDHDEDDDDDASTVLFESSKQEPTKQDDVTSVPASLDVTTAFFKTEIAFLWTNQSCSSLSSSSSSLILSLSETTSAPNLDQESSVVSFLPLPLPVPVKFVSAQGPGRVLEQPSDQSASFEKKVHQATAPISGTEWSTSNTSDKEKEEDEGRNLFLPSPADITPSSHRAEENIFSRRFCSEDQEHPSSISHSLGSHSPSPSRSHSPTCQQELDQGHHQQDPSGLTISHTINDNNSHSDSHGDKHQLKDQHVSRLWPVLPYDLEVKAALDECLGDIYHFTSSAPNSAANSRYSTRTSHDDAKSVYQYEGPMDEGCDVYHDYQAPLPSPPLLKGVVATTTVTTAVADAVRLDQDKSSAASSPQQLYQQLLSSSPPVASSAGSTKSLLIASTLPLPPVAILVLDRKEPVRAAGVTEDLDSKDLPPVLLPGQQEDLIEQHPRAMTVKRASTTEVLDKGFLNGLFAGTVSRWTRPTPTTAPVPPIMITTSAMASTTSPLLRHVNRGRGLAAQSGDLADMDPFWDF